MKIDAHTTGTLSEERTLHGTKIRETIAALERRNQTVGFLKFKFKLLVSHPASVE